MWSGKQIFSLILKPNKECPVKVNLEAKGKVYTANREMCVKDSYVLIRNSELIAGTLDKTHLGSGGKGGNVFYLILRDVSQENSIKSMWRLCKICLGTLCGCGVLTVVFFLARMASAYLMNCGFSIGIGDVTPGENLVQRKNKLLKQGYVSDFFVHSE